jgi:acyl dehydratase
MNTELSRSNQPTPRNLNWDDVRDGDPLPTLHFPLTVCRLVMAAGANRDFNAIHHNSDYAKASGAPEMYANNLFLQGMWERAVREYIGPGGVIRKLAGFRMKVFNTVGDTVVVKGHVLRKWMEDGVGSVEFELRSENANGVSVGPGRIVATMPLRKLLATLATTPA